MKRKLWAAGIPGLLFLVSAFFFLEGIGVPNALALSFLGGILFVLLLWLCLIISEKTDNRRYAEFEKDIASPVFYKARGNFALGGGKVRSGRIYFCDSGIVCVSLDAKPCRLDEIPIPAIDRIAFDQVRLHVYVKDGRVFYITLPDAKHIIELLRQRDWVE